MLFGVHIKVGDVAELLQREADFGHHLAVVYGDYTQELKEVGKVMKFDVEEV